MARASGYPDDVTWDDVRLARPKRKGWAVASVVAFVVAIGVATLLGARDETPIARATEREVVRVAKRATPRERTLCQALRQWSSGTVLRLGTRTRLACGE